MTVVRQLIGQFGVSFDRRSANKAKTQMDSAFSSLRNIGATLIAGAAATGLAKLASMASATVENLNVINVAFEDSAEDVLAWSQTFGDATQRSRFHLQKMASSFGAVLTPMLGGASKQSAELSKRLSEIAVDLGSLYNISDEAARTKILSGLTGETEPMKALGIVMSVANLELFAREQGIRKNFKALKESEKAELRAQFIVAKSALAHGDAAKTAQEYENQLKGMKAAASDLGIQIGLKLIPIFKVLVGGAKTGIKWFSELFRNTKVLETAFVLLTAVAAKFGLSFLKFLAPLLKAAAPFLILGLIIEDFWTLLDGGDSVIGRLIDSIMGPGSATAAVEGMKLAWADLNEYWTNSVIPSFKHLKDQFSDFISKVKTEWGPSFAEFILNMKVGFSEALGAASTQFKMFENNILNTFDAIRLGWERFKSALGVGDEAAVLDIQRAIASRARDSQALLADAAVNRIRGMTARLNIATATAGGAGGSPVTINQNTAVNVNGNATPAAATQIATATGREVGRKNRAAAAALLQRAN